MIPKMNATRVRKTEAEAITPKNVQVVYVHRNAVESNIAAQPARYPTLSAKNTNIGILSSRRAPYQPCEECKLLYKQLQSGV
jgi:hypothetical protein